MTASSLGPFAFGLRPGWPILFFMVDGEGAWHLALWRLLTKRARLLEKDLLSGVGTRQVRLYLNDLTSQEVWLQYLLGVIWSLMSCRSRSSPFPTSILAH